jgi:hypothetical protein
MVSIWGQPQSYLTLRLSCGSVMGLVSSISTANTVPSESIHTPWLFPHFDVTAWILNWLNWDTVSLIYTQYPIMSKWNYVFQNCTTELQIQSWIVLSQYVFHPFVMANLNKFRSKNVLIDMLHGLTLCAIIMFSMILKLLPHLCT